MESAVPSEDVSAYRARSYQLEMFEAGCKENVIVAMDTGSGKTQVAVLRIRAELENCRPEKLIWFLAPTVSLCLQQQEVISSQIPAVRTRSLTSLDKVELWTEQPIWDAVLKDVRVVVSTYAVLADALSHGFVRISQLALVIFDEAHHCMGRHPANKIMQDYYHPTLAKFGRDAVPHILGLTASPVFRSSYQELVTIETNLNSICKTPRMHRHELLTYTSRPEMQRLWFKPCDPDGIENGSLTLRALLQAYRSLNIENDPYVKKLRKSTFEAKELKKVLDTGKTNCREQLKKFVKQSCHIFEELGEWATDYFISASIEQFRASVREPDNLVDWEDEEKLYLLEIFSHIPTPDLTFRTTNLPISSKVESLAAFLYHMDEPEFSGLIFAKQRATVSVLAKVLSVHPLTKDRFRCAAYVGWSSGRGKDTIGELFNMKMQRDTLDEFRSGNKNLIIATDVLEEGIDVTACSLVVCCDRPPTLKSFVQRRGRARQKKSTYAIMFPTDDETSYMSRWMELEKAMVEAYQDDQRRLCEAIELEAVDEDVMEKLQVESTCALLATDTAMSHLYHFCAILPHQTYVDNRPVFSFDTPDEKLVRATVTLPSCVHPEVRRAQGKRWWKTERAAMKEAAFQAYKRLYEFGLVNDHLLPLSKKPELHLNDCKDMPSMVEALEQYDPWVEIAHSWATPNIHQSRIIVHQNGFVDDGLCMNLMIPTFLPDLEPMTLFWDKDTSFEVHFEPAQQALATVECVEQMRMITDIYLKVPRSKQTDIGKDFVTLFGPNLRSDELASWVSTNGGYHPASELYGQGNPVLGLIREQSRYKEDLLIFKKWVVSDNKVELECDPFPRRRNLLHRQTLATAQSEDDSPAPKVKTVSVDKCTVDKLPLAQAIFGLFIPVILDRMEATLIATKLCETVLKGVGFTGTRHVITAITAPSAQALTNYQRYEFLGDSVLKFTVSCQLYFQHQNWHEGYLSESRDAIIQNPRLARAALDAGLDAFIINKMFTPRKWSAPLISEKVEQTPTRRTMSTKVLADVVESLIGAAFIDGGHSKAQACIRRFLPEINLNSLDIRTQTPANPALDNLNNRLKDAIGYTFTNESLLVEALTHPSCEYDAQTQSYQRLEFLGDAVLDMIVVKTIFSHESEIPQGDMTLIKHAVVNANLLSFFCMEFNIVETKTAIQQYIPGQFEITPDTETLHLWQFMRCHGPTMISNRNTCLTRHADLRGEIASSLLHAGFYPWQTLSQLHPDKHFSDIIESILGAIFVDSGGDLSVCELFVEKLGILPYLRRVLSTGINVVHPRNMSDRISKGEAKFKVTRVQLGNNGSGNASYSCVVSMAGSVIVDIKGCLTSDEAEVTAAMEANRVLESSAMGRTCV